MAPQTLFEDRILQIDLRLTKVFRLGGSSLDVNLDIYNLLNASAVTNVNATFGPNWRNVTQIMAARYFKLGAQIDF